MGADLIAGIVEIERGKEPNWEAAREYLEALEDKAFVDTVTAQFDWDLESMSEILQPDQARRRCMDAFENCMMGWAQQLRTIIKVCLAATDALLAADRTCGDRVEAVDDIELFIESGAAEVAGFLAGDRYRNRVACWLDRSQGVDIVTTAAAKDYFHELVEDDVECDADEARADWDTDMAGRCRCVVEALKQAGIKPDEEELSQSKNELEASWGKPEKDEDESDGE